MQQAPAGKLETPRCWHDHFYRGLDFTGKTVHPVTTYAVGGLGSTERDYAASCPGATLGEGLAVRGEEVKEAGADGESWLRRARLLTK